MIYCYIFLFYKNAKTATTTTSFCLRLKHKTLKTFKAKLGLFSRLRRFHDEVFITMFLIFVQF